MFWAGGRCDGCAWWRGASVSHGGRVGMRSCEWLGGLETVMSSGLLVLSARFRLCFGVGGICFLSRILSLTWHRGSEKVDDGGCRSMKKFSGSSGLGTHGAERGEVWTSLQADVFMDQLLLTFALSLSSSSVYFHGPANKSASCLSSPICARKLVNNLALLGPQLQARNSRQPQRALPTMRTARVAIPSSPTKNHE